MNRKDWVGFGKTRQITRRCVVSPAKDCVPVGNIAIGNSICSVSGGHGIGNSITGNGGRLVFDGKPGAVPKCGFVAEVVVISAKTVSGGFGVKGIRHRKQFRSSHFHKGGASGRINFSFNENRSCAPVYGSKTACDRCSTANFEGY